jgi:phosphatidylglycerophosphate synthase
MSPAIAAAPATVGAGLCPALAWGMSAALALSSGYVSMALATFIAMMAAALVGIAGHHPFERVGFANLITGFRAVITALIAGALTQAPTRGLAWTLVAVAIVAAVLDGFDGWAARRQRMSSAFGARFDMEVDAFLIMVLSTLAWRFGKAGPWVLASGLMRYAFVGAAWVWPWLNAPLPRSRRRQTVCVWQIGVLIGTIAPIIRPPLSELVAAGALIALAWSFWVDVRWLMKARGAN